MQPQRTQPRRFPAHEAPVSTFRRYDVCIRASARLFRLVQPNGPFKLSAPRTRRCGRIRSSAPWPLRPSDPRPRWLGFNLLQAPSSSFKHIRSFNHQEFCRICGHPIFRLPAPKSGARFRSFSLIFGPPPPAGRVACSEVCPRRRNDAMDTLLLSLFAIRHSSFFSASPSRS
jgi:hypothetical protein